MLPVVQRGRLASNMVPSYCHPFSFRLSWHLLKVGKGVWQDSCPVSTIQGWGWL